jgi:hypothetical protein
MSDNKSLDPFDALSQAYEKMYEQVASGVDKATHKTGPLIHELVDEAEEKISDLEDITKDDAKKLAGWLRRDFDDAINYVSETENAFEEWLGFETSLLKAEFIQALLDTADKTTLALLRMKENAHEPYKYHTGEIVGFGTLICDECGEKVHFHQASKIPPCPKCHETSFHRIQTD